MSACRAASFSSGSTTSPIRLALAQDRGRDRDDASRLRGLRAQWRHQREGVKPGAQPADLRRGPTSSASPASPRRSSPRPRSSRRREWRSTSPASASRRRRRTCSASKRSSPATPRSAPTIIRASSRWWRRGTRPCCKLRRTTIEAPLDGVVSKRPVPGSYATAGVPVMVVVADTDLWIEANFKETELTLRAAGPARDHQGRHLSRRRLHRQVASIAQATGAEFAVLPPQNASGNWVKVVQRIPVSIAVDLPRRRSAARVGMSTTSRSTPATAARSVAC